MRDQLDFWPTPTPQEPLRWSISKDRRLRGCARKYYYFHYGSRGGANADPNSWARSLYILKLLRNRYMWVGEVVHELIEEVMQQWRLQQEVDVEALVDKGVRTMRARFCESRRGDYRRRPETACGLIEHEYNEDISREQWQALRDRMERCLRNFVSLPLAATFRQMPRSRWLALETQGSFDLDGATVVVKPDFAWQAAKNKICIADWKTGAPREEDERFQLAVYALHGRRVWRVASETLEGHVVYLDSGETRVFVLDRSTLQKAERQVHRSINVMRKLDKLAVACELDVSFPMTDDVDQCRGCAFRRVCARS